MMCISILIGMLMMCTILIAETLIEPKQRLSWPYGDLVPGGYVAKVSLPVFCVLMAISYISLKNFQKNAYFLGNVLLGFHLFVCVRVCVCVCACLPRTLILPA